jgi:hypothetical protein
VIKFSLGIPYSYVSALVEVRDENWKLYLLALSTHDLIATISGIRLTRLQRRSSSNLDLSRAPRLFPFSRSPTCAAVSLFLTSSLRRPPASSSGTARIIYSTPGPSRSMLVPHCRPPLEAPWTQIEPPPPRLLSAQNRRRPPAMVLHGHGLTWWPAGGDELGGDEVGSGGTARMGLAGRFSSRVRSCSSPTLAARLFRPQHSPVAKA